MTKLAAIQGAGAGLDAGEVQREIEGILARPQFHPEESHLDGFAGFLSSIFGSVVSAEQAFEIAWAVAIGVAVAISLFMVVRAWRLRQAPRRSEAVDGDSQTARRRDVKALRLAAAEARAAGDLRAALRLTWFALVVGLGQRGSLGYHAAWTNRELLERGDPAPEARELLEPLLREIEAKEFGHEPTTERDVERLDELCRTALAGGAL